MAAFLTMPYWGNELPWLKTSFCVMVANVTCSCMSHIQTAQDIFIEKSRPKLSFVKI